jgi:hypothetical protein
MKMDLFLPMNRIRIAVTISIYFAEEWPKLLTIAGHTER